MKRFLSTLIVSALLTSSTLHAGGIAEIVEEPEVMAPERGKFPWVPVIIGAVILGAIVCNQPEVPPAPTPGGDGGCF
mgnify:CR=1 FL=1